MFSTKPFVAALLAASSCALSAVSASTAVKAVSTKSACQDDPEFRFQGEHGHTCQWLARQDQDLCAWEVLDEEDEKAAGSGFAPSTIGQTHCPVSCGHCVREVTETSVFTDNICYDQKKSSSLNSGVVVSFENTEPHANDWVGIYNVLKTKDSLEVGSKLKEEPVAWSWLCDITLTGIPNTRDDHGISTSCHVGYNQVLFRQMPAGIYQTVLARGNDEIFAIAPSHFEVLGRAGNKGSNMCAQRKLQLQSNNTEGIDDDEGCDHVEVDSLTYAVGQDINIELQQCEDSAQPGDFVAIYHADTDLADIKGDANYVTWMWTCGSQSCHENSTASSLTFGSESNKHTWPLPPGNYQAHLVKHIAHEDRFASVAQSSAFAVEEEPASVQMKKKRKMQQDCLDMIRTKDHCYEEGDKFSVLLAKECSSLGKEDWFGFYHADDCSEVDHVCQGEPVIWSMVCREGTKDCEKHQTAEYRFSGRRGEDHEEPFMLRAGEYRVVLVANEDDNGEGPYFAQLISQPMQIRRQGDSCHTTQRQS